MNHKAFLAPLINNSPNDLFPTRKYWQFYQRSQMQVFFHHSSTLLSEPKKTCPKLQWRDRLRIKINIRQHREVNIRFFFYPPWPYEQQCLSFWSYFQSTAAFRSGSYWPPFCICFVPGYSHVEPCAQAFSWSSSGQIKVTRPSFFEGVPSYFEALWYPHLYFYRKSNT